MRRLKRWSVPIIHKLLAAFGRREITPMTSLPVPKTCEEHFFDLTEEKIKTETICMDDIQKKATWNTKAPRTAHKAYAEAAVMKYWRQIGCWDATRLWMCDILPEFQVVQKEGTTEKLLILDCTMSTAALGFPVEENNGVIELAPYLRGSIGIVLLCSLSQF